MHLPNTWWILGATVLNTLLSMVLSENPCRERGGYCTRGECRPHSQKLVEHICKFAYKRCCIPNDRKNKKTPTIKSKTKQKMRRSLTPQIISSESTIYPLYIDDQYNNEHTIETNSSQKSGRDNIKQAIKDPGKIKKEAKAMENIKKGKKNKGSINIGKKNKANIKTCNMNKAKIKKGNKNKAEIKKPEKSKAKIKKINEKKAEIKKPKKSIAKIKIANKNKAEIKKPKKSKVKIKKGNKNKSEIKKPKKSKAKIKKDNKNKADIKKGKKNKQTIKKDNKNKAEIKKYKNIIANKNNNRKKREIVMKDKENKANIKNGKKNEAKIKKGIRQCEQQTKACKMAGGRCICMTERCSGSQSTQVLCKGPASSCCLKRDSKHQNLKMINPHQKIHQKYKSKQKRGINLTPMIISPQWKKYPLYIDKKYNKWHVVESKSSPKRERRDIKQSKKDTGKIENENKFKEKIKKGKNSKAKIKKGKKNKVKINKIKKKQPNTKQQTQQCEQQTKACKGAGGRCICKTESCSGSQSIRVLCKGSSSSCCLKRDSNHQKLKIISDHRKVSQKFRDRKYKKTPTFKSKTKEKMIIPKKNKGKSNKAKDKQRLQRCELQTKACKRAGGKCICKTESCPGSQSTKELCKGSASSCCLNKRVPDAGCKANSRCSNKGGVCVPLSLGCPDGQKPVAGCNPNKCNCCIQKVPRCKQSTRCSEKLGICRPKTTRCLEGELPLSGCNAKNCNCCVLKENIKVEGCECGISNELRVVGGEEVTPGHKYPWQIWISRNSLFQCGGTIINDKYILTAAHCLVVRSNNCEVVSEESIKVVIADHDIKSNEDNLPNVTRVVDIEKIIIHEDFTCKKDDDDIALLKMAESLDLGKSIVLQSVCLPVNDDITFEGEVGIATGWGLTNPGTRLGPDILHEVELKIASPTCPGFKGMPGTVMASSMICAGEPGGGKDTCDGDSGGPLIVEDKNGRYLQVGITSFGPVACNGPGVYTRVSSFLKWIKENTKDANYCE